MDDVYEADRREHARHRPVHATPDGAPAQRDARTVHQLTVPPPTPPRIIPRLDLGTPNRQPAGLGSSPRSSPADRSADQRRRRRHGAARVLPWPPIQQIGVTVSISGKANAVSTPTRGRLGAACGAIFSIALFVANGNGHGGYSPYRYVVGAVAIVLFLPFLAYLCGLFRQADSANGWLSTTALAAGITGIALKLLSGAPEIAIHRAHVADGTQLHEALQGVGGAATVVSLYPLALLLTVVAV